MWPAFRRASPPTRPRCCGGWNCWVCFGRIWRSWARGNRHELLRCHELIHRAWVGEAHLRHMLHRQETRWPGFYYRSDYPEMDEANWRVFVNSRYDAEKDEWSVFTRPCPRVF